MCQIPHGSNPNFIQMPSVGSRLLFTFFRCALAIISPILSTNRSFIVRHAAINFRSAFSRLTVTLSNRFMLINIIASVPRVLFNQRDNPEQQPQHDILYYSLATS